MFIYMHCFYYFEQYFYLFQARQYMPYGECICNIYRVPPTQQKCRHLFSVAFRGAY